MQIRLLAMNNIRSLCWDNPQNKVKFHGILTSPLCFPEEIYELKWCFESSVWYLFSLIPFAFKFFKFYLYHLKKFNILFIMFIYLSYSLLPGFMILISTMFRVLPLSSLFEFTKLLLLFLSFWQSIVHLNSTTPLATALFVEVSTAMQ